MREPKRIVLRVPTADETPWKAHERGAYLRYQGKTWLVEEARVSVPGGTVVHLVESTPQENSEILDWAGPGAG